MLLLLACVPKDDPASDAETGPGDTSGETAEDTAEDSAEDTAEDSGDSDTADSGDSDSGDSDSGDTGGALPDVREAMDESSAGCDELGGRATSGAATYYWGEYLEAGAGWTGLETVYVYANPTWVAAGGADCVGVWNVTATPTDTGSCGACEVGLSVVAEYDRAASTCDPDQFGGDFDVSYAVDVAGTAATWKFASSGNPFGEGYWVDGSGNFLTERTCIWF